MLFWALLNLRVLLRAPAKRAMRGRAVHARSPIDAALSSTDATKNTGERCLLVPYMTLAPPKSRSGVRAARSDRTLVLTLTESHSRSAIGA